MGELTAIEWTDHSFNPWIGCAKVSPGCKHCYAESVASHWKLGEWGKNAERRRTSPANWAKVYRWDRAAAAAGVRRRVFCASMADVFEARPDLDPARRDLWDLIESTPNLDWLLLTKRPEAIAEMVPPKWLVDPPRNVWMGTSVETIDQLGRLDYLCGHPWQTFLSCEPLLGPLGRHLNLEGIDWVIVGGESGPKARPMHPEWAHEIRRACQAQEVPLLFKQWGEWMPAGENPGACLPTAKSIVMPYEGRAPWYQEVREGERMYRVGKKAAGRLLNGRTWDELPCPEWGGAA